MKKPRLGASATHRSLYASPRKPLKTSLLVLAVVFSLGFAFWPAESSAELTVVGEGKEEALDRDQFSAEMAERYDLFAARCTKCHELGRPITALVTGMTPVTGSTFDDAGMKKYVVKMMRKPNSGIDKADAKEILTFLRYARDIHVNGNGE